MTSLSWPLWLLADVQVPQAGTFPHYATRFVDPALGFTLAISYGYCYTIAIASEVSAAAVLVVGLP